MNRCVAALLLLAACSSQSPTPSSELATRAACTAAPPLETTGEVALYRALPNFDFAGIDTTGTSRTLALAELQTPCAANSESARALVIRVSAAWCGTCRAAVAHSNELVESAVGARTEILDLVVGNDDNMPPSASDLAKFAAETHAPRFVAADPEHRFRDLNPQRAPLPLIAIVDRASMRIQAYMNDPSPVALSAKIASVLAKLDNAPDPTPALAASLHDGRFTEARWEMIAAMRNPGAPPPDPTNAHADDPRAAAFGKALFFDASLSPSGRIACATCHDPDKGFSDGLPQSEGVSGGDRNAPAIAFSAYSRWQFWDGRADSLWMQALGPIENPKEMGGSRLEALHRIYDREAARAAYEGVFGPLPNLADAARFPAKGGPASPEWEAMGAADREAATQAFVNLGKAIEAYERSIVVLPNPLDRYAGGDTTALSESEKDGLLGFFEGGCAQCHYGPRLSDDSFHAVAFGTGRKDRSPDRGRIDGAASLLASDFSALGRFADANAASPSHADLAAVATTTTMLGAFATASLRGVPETAPYGHGGTFAKLEDVMKHYAEGATDAPPGTYAGTTEPWIPKLDDKRRDAITSFLRTLSAETPR